MSDYPAIFSPGSKIDLGSHTFKQDEIVDFAKKFDPQVFHVDPVAARQTFFGGLCASGWHTLSVWMKLMRAATDRLEAEKTIAAQGYSFAFGPSPGFDNLKWLKPVFVDDTIFYRNEVMAIRASTSRPPWHIMQTRSWGINQHDEPVLEFESAVMLRLEKLDDPQF